jgi:hypothetical protein
LPRKTSRWRWLPPTPESAANEDFQVNSYTTGSPFLHGAVATPDGGFLALMSVSYPATHELAWFDSEGIRIRSTMITSPPGDLPELGIAPSGNVHRVRRQQLHA